MKKWLIALLAGLMFCQAACAQPQQMVTAQRAVELPEGYYLVNSENIERVADGGERWSAVQDPQSVEEWAAEGADVVMTEGGLAVMEIRNLGFVGGDHTRMPELEKTIRAQFETELAEKGVQFSGSLVRQYADRLHLAAFGYASGEPVGRIITIDDEGCLIDIWCHTMEGAASILLDSLAEAVEMPEVYVRATTEVNVRSGPGTNYDKVGMLRVGDTLLFTGETHVDDKGREWISILLGGETVWVTSQYIEFVE